LLVGKRQTSCLTFLRSPTLDLAKSVVHGGTRIIGLPVIKAALSATDPKVLDMDVD
jgi:hypothetical protein